MHTAVIGINGDWRFRFYVGYVDVAACPRTLR
jgi:hypothetical protein